MQWYTIPYILKAMIYCNGHYYSGYFEKSIREKKSIEKLIASSTYCHPCFIAPPYGNETDCPYEDESGMIFLDGSCNLFAKQLHDHFGYDVYEVSDGSGNHWYCLTDYNHKRLYIDIRGATTDFCSFSNRYSFIKSEMEPKPILRTELTFENEPWRDTGAIFARNIIAENKGFYGGFYV